MTVRAAHRFARLAFGLLGGWFVSGVPSAGADFDTPLVVTQAPSSPKLIAPGAGHGPLAQPAEFPGARLVVLTPDGQVRPLTSGFDSASDPNVSFDGQRVLFAGRRERGAPSRIWEIGIDGRGLRAVSPENLDAHSPIHVSTLFTLDSPEPWYTTVFVGREPTLNEAGRIGAFSLYNVKLDGTELRRLTYAPNANLDPHPMWDGRILYAAERHPQHPDAPPPDVRIHAIHIEGADMELYGAGLARRIRRSPCAIPGGLVVFVESDAPTPDASGQLGGVDERRPHRVYRELTHDPAFVYRQPALFRDASLLVARRPNRDDGHWGIVAFDTRSGVCEVVFDTPGYDEVQAVTAVPRSRPDGHSTVVESRYDSGIFYGLNAYDADPSLAPHVRTGMIHRVRLIEGVAAPATEGERPDGKPPWVARRLVGEAPVEADGSFNVEVPADVPLLLQTLDERGMALATCGWIWVKPGEKRGCIGCHEDPERIPENHYVRALQRPSDRLVLPPEKRRAVSFRDDIAPLLQRHCATAECHGNSTNDLHLPLTALGPSESQLWTAYTLLLEPLVPGAQPPTGTVPRGRYVDAGRARTSRLAWHLSGANTARPWDLGTFNVPSLPGPVPQMPPPGKSEPLDPELRRTFVQWIDMGAPFAPPPPPARTP